MTTIPVLFVHDNITKSIFLPVATFFIIPSFRLPRVLRNNESWNLSSSHNYKPKHMARNQETVLRVIHRCFIGVIADIDIYNMWCWYTT